MADAPEDKKKNDAEVENEAEQSGDDELNLDTNARSTKIKKAMKILVLCLLVIGGGASYVLIKMAQEEPTIRQLTPISADGTVIDPNKVEAPKEHLSNTETKGKANYYNVSPSFIINLLSKDDRRHYIQFDVSIMTRDSSLFYKLEHHDPIIKSVILSVASSQSYESLSTLKGREKFREQLVEELRTRLEDLTGSTAVEEVLFTKFIME